MNAERKILLVHGAWHGSWCFQPLTDLLTQRGWHVETIDLPTVHSENAAELTVLEARMGETTDTRTP